MNKIVRENYPASKLPEDLRAGMDPAATVTVTVSIDDDTPTHKPMTLEEIFALRHPPYRTAEEIVSDIRQIRDEQDD